MIQLGSAALIHDFWHGRKEKLWPHLREFADHAIAHAKRTVGALAENKTPCELYVIHGHYADASEIAAMMSFTLIVDMVMTGHSLGRNKLEHLLASGTACLCLSALLYNLQ